jgi:hypothetical protein
VKANSTHNYVFYTFSICKLLFGIHGNTCQYCLTALSKSRDVLVQTVIANRGRANLAPLILILGTRLRLVVYFTPRPLYLWERTPVLIEQDGGWAPESLDGFGEEKNPLPLLGFESRTVQTVANHCKHGFIYSQYCELV